MPPLHGTIAAALTPLVPGGGSLDDDAIAGYVDFLVAGGLDGLLAFGTNGEAVLFDVEERMRGLETFIEAAGDRLLVAVHCGAQTTRDTTRLASHAAAVGADAVAVIGPPYFKLDPEAQRRHLVEAARACEPLPFYVYEFAATAGYAFDLEMLRRLRDDAPNFTGLKVSDAPFEAFARYLLDGLDVFVGPEALIGKGRAAGAIGAVSALAGVYPERVAAVVRAPSEEGAAALGALRARLERFPRHAAAKRLLAARGVPVCPDVRPPLRDLAEDELRAFEQELPGFLAEVAP